MSLKNNAEDKENDIFFVGRWDLRISFFYSDYFYWWSFSHNATESMNSNKRGYYGNGYYNEYLFAECMHFK